MSKSVKVYNTYSVFVGHIQPSVTRGRLKELFKQCGEIVDIVLMDRSIYGDAYNYGFVRFAEASEAKRAVREMDGWETSGLRLTVELSRDTLKKLKEENEPQSKRASGKTGASRPTQAKLLIADALYLQRLEEHWIDLKMHRKEVDCVSLNRLLDDINKRPGEKFALLWGNNLCVTNGHHSSQAVADRIICRCYNTPGKGEIYGKQKAAEYLSSVEKIMKKLGLTEPQDHRVAAETCQENDDIECDLGNCGDGKNDEDEDDDLCNKGLISMLQRGRPKKTNKMEAGRNISETVCPQSDKTLSNSQMDNMYFAPIKEPSIHDDKIKEHSTGEDVRKLNEKRSTVEVIPESECDATFHAVHKNSSQHVDRVNQNPLVQKGNEISPIHNDFIDTQSCLCSENPNKTQSHHSLHRAIHSDSDLLINRSLPMRNVGELQENLRSSPQQQFPLTDERVDDLNPVQKLYLQLRSGDVCPPMPLYRSDSADSNSSEGSVEGYIIGDSGIETDFTNPPPGKFGRQTSDPGLTMQRYTSSNSAEAHSHLAATPAGAPGSAPSGGRCVNGGRKRFVHGETSLMINGQSLHQPYLGYNQQLYGIPNQGGGRGLFLNLKTQANSKQQLGPSSSSFSQPQRSSFRKLSTSPEVESASGTSGWESTSLPARGGKSMGRGVLGILQGVGRGIHRQGNC